MTPEKRYPSIKTFSDAALFSRGDLLDLPESLERTVIRDEAQQTATFGAWLANTVFDTFAKRNTQKISQEEANETYGIKDHLQFEEPVSPELARNRYERTRNHLARLEIMRMEQGDNGILQNTLNFGNAITGAVLFDPITYISPTTGIANFLGGIKSLGVIQRSAKLAKYVDASYNLLTDVNALGRPFAVGAAKGVADVAIPQLATELAIKDMADQNGYDYDFMSSMAFVFFGSTAGGLLGGALARASAKNISNSVMFLDNIIQRDIVPKQTIDNLIVKSAEDLTQGRIMGPMLTQSYLKIQDDQRTLAKFITEVEEGNYPFITESVARSTTIDKIPQLKNIADFKAWVIRAINAPLSNKPFGVDLSPEFVKKYGQDFSSVSKTRKIVETLSNEIQKLQTDLSRLTTSKKIAKNKGQRKQVEQSKQLLRQQIAELEDELREAQSVHGSTLSLRVDRLVAANAAKPKLETMSWSTYLGNYKKLANRIKRRKVKDVNNFFRLSQETQEDIYRLYEMSGRNLDDELELSSLLNIADDDLAMVHQEKIFRKELENVSTDEARKYVNDYFMDPDFETNRILDEFANEQAQILNRNVRVADLPDASLQAEIDFFRRQIDEMADPEVLDDIRKFEKDLEDEVFKDQGIVEALNCFAQAARGIK